MTKCQYFSNLRLDEARLYPGRREPLQPISKPRGRHPFRTAEPRYGRLSGRHLRGIDAEIGRSADEKSGFTALFFRLCWPSRLPAAKTRSAATIRQSPATGIGPVSFPAFLDRPQLVTRGVPTELWMDELNRWVGSLQDDFPRVPGENLGYLLGTSRILTETADVRYPVDFRVAVDFLTVSHLLHSSMALRAP